jgi:hypothetical protein
MVVLDARHSRSLTQFYFLKKKKKKKGHELDGQICMYVAYYMF